MMKQAEGMRKEKLDTVAKDFDSLCPEGNNDMDRTNVNVPSQDALSQINTKEMR